MMKKQGEGWFLLLVIDHRRDATRRHDLICTTNDDDDDTGMALAVTGAIGACSCNACWLDPTS
jgi:hypothetical protein